MQQRTATKPAFSTDGYFFSPLPFSQTERIDALQLAIVLGVNEDVEAETILIARSGIDHNEYQLAIVGRSAITDDSGQPVDSDQLRNLPVEELCEQKLRSRGWSVRSKPYFVWLKDSTPLNHTRSDQIYSNAYNQLQTLHLSG